MTLRIEVTVPEGEVQAGAGGRYLDQALSALGFNRASTALSSPQAAPVVGHGPRQPQKVDDDYTDRVQAAHGADALVSPDDYEAPASEETPAAEPVRLRGETAEGRKRRTKDEMAEDKALEDAAEKAGVPIEKIDGALANGHSRAEVLAGLSAKSAVTEDTDKPAISTGEERVGPEDEQDRADEAAESAAKSDGSLTLDDLRKAAGDYQKAYGMAAAVKDVEVILGCKMNDVADGDLETAIGLLRSAIDENPHKRDRVGAKTAETPAAKKPATAPRTATKQDVIDAMLAYAKKYDGPDATPAKPETMPFTTADAPVVFTKLFGPEVNRLGLIPDSPENYGKAVAGLEEMLAVDPFKRGSSNG